MDGSNQPNPLAGDFLTVLKQRRLISDIPSNPGSRSEFVETTVTTILSFKYAGGVLVAGDRRATEGNVVMYDRADKVLEIDRHSVIAIAGSPAIAWEMARILGAFLPILSTEPAPGNERGRQGTRALEVVARQFWDGDARGWSGRSVIRNIRQEKFGCGQGVLLRRHGCPIRSHRLCFKWLRSPRRQECALLREQLGFETVTGT